MMQSIEKRMHLGLRELANWRVRQFDSDPHPQLIARSDGSRLIERKRPESEVIRLERIACKCFAVTTVCHQSKTL